VEKDPWTSKFSSDLSLENFKNLNFKALPRMYACLFFFKLVRLRKGGALVEQVLRKMFKTLEM